VIQSLDENGTPLSVWCGILLDASEVGFQRFYPRFYYKFDTSAPDTTQALAGSLLST
jgi:hypothetical protein